MADAARGGARRHDGRARRHHRRHRQPGHRQDLGASLADLQWVTNGYLLALAVSLITAGKLGDRFGHKPDLPDRRRPASPLASGAIGLSRQHRRLIALRVLQGLFGALLQPAALGLLRAAFPGREAQHGHRRLGRAHRRVHRRPARSSAACWSSTSAGSRSSSSTCRSASSPWSWACCPARHTRGERAAPLRLPRHGPAVRRDVLPRLGPHQGPGRGAGATRTTLGFVAGVRRALRGLRRCWQSRARQPLIPLSLFRSGRSPSAWC